MAVPNIAGRFITESEKEQRATPNAKGDQQSLLVKRLDGYKTELATVRSEVDKVKLVADAATNVGLVADINRRDYTLDTLRSDLSLGTSAGLNHKADALETPDRTFDNTKGYKQFEMIQTKDGKVYMCTSTETGNAVWKEITFV